MRSPRQPTIDRLARVGVLIAILCTTPGCLSGWVYTDVTVPLVTNVGDTPRGTRQVELSSHEVKVRGITWADINSRAIADAAKRYGLERISLADERTISVFGGLYRRRSVLVWGE